MSQVTPTQNWLTPMLDDSARFVSDNSRQSVPLLLALAALTALLAAAIFFRHRRRRTDAIHRSPWSADARKHRPSAAPLIASGAYRQRRRRRRSATTPKPS